jgi:predicted DNA-binding transcriptional regulator AlpA
MTPLCLSTLTGRECNVSAVKRLPVSSVQRSGESTQRGRLTVDDICNDLDISRRTFYEWRAKGTAPKCIKLPNGELRVSHAEYGRWLKEREKAA